MRFTHFGHVNSRAVDRLNEVEYSPSTSIGSFQATVLPSLPEYYLPDLELQVSGVCPVPRPERRLAPNGHCKCSTLRVQG